MSSVDRSLAAPLQPFYKPESDNATESAAVQGIVDKLRMQKHPEGGYFVETDRDIRTVPNPFVSDGSTNASDRTRAASTTIFYLITPKRTFGAFHRNKARTVHTLHYGRGRYAIIHADEVKDGKQARVETFVVGHSLAKGEKLQWIVEGGKYKASYLLPDEDEGEASNGLLISETVCPGFEFSDHDFLSTESFAQLVPEAQRKELAWLLRKG